MGTTEPGNPSKPPIPGVFDHIPSFEGLANPKSLTKQCTTVVRHIRELKTRCYTVNNTAELLSFTTASNVTNILTQIRNDPDPVSKLSLCSS